jgi:hypothetical protein
MKFRAVSSLVLLWLALFSLPCLAEKLVSIDPKAKVINVDTGGGLKAFRLKDPVEVKVDGVAAQLEQLQPGMQVTLGMADAQSVNRILATSAAAAPLGQAAEGEAGRHITIKAKIDGKDTFKVKNGKIWIEHNSWSKPSEISINGHSWKPQWSGDHSDEFINFTPPLTPFGAKPVEVRKIKGRGSVTIKQTPAPENGATLAVEFNDSTENGAAIYEARISW